MYIAIIILMIIISILLVLIVLVQNSKGGGLAANFTGSQVMGVRRTADFLEKATWTLASAILVLAIVANIIMPRQVEVERKSLIEDQVKNAIDPNAVPNFPTSAPASQPAQNAQPAPENK